MNTVSGNSYVRRAVYGFIAIIALLLLCGIGIGACKSTNNTEPGEVSVIRNGGIFDSKTIREVRPPESAYKISGLWSSKRPYISSDQQRYYTVSTDEGASDNPGVTFVSVPTQDGVQVALEATAYFNTAFTGLDGDPLLKQFDSEFGNREFRGIDGESYHVWEDNDGWNAFLDTIFKPILENAIREEIGELNCAELVSSCALIEAGAGQSTDKVTDLAELAEQGEDNNANFAEVQEGIQTKLEERVESTLGEPYLQNFQFKLVRVQLPDNVQDSINETQSAFAEISTAQAEAAKAKFEADKLRRLAEQYAKSPELAQIEAIKALGNNPAATIILGQLDGGLNLGK